MQIYIFKMHNFDENFKNFHTLLIYRIFQDMFSITTLLFQILLTTQYLFRLASLLKLDELYITRYYFVPPAFIKSVECQIHQAFFSHYLFQTFLLFLSYTLTLCWRQTKRENSRNTENRMCLDALRESNPFQAGFEYIVSLHWLDADSRHEFPVCRVT